MDPTTRVFIFPIILKTSPIAGWVIDKAWDNSKVLSSVNNRPLGRNLFDLEQLKAEVVDWERQIERWKARSPSPKNSDYLETQGTYRDQ